MPNIDEMLLKLEGFKYASSLDLNMGYYHIRLKKTQVIYLQSFYLGVNNVTNIYQWELLITHTFYFRI